MFERPTVFRFIPSYWLFYTRGISPAELGLFSYLFATILEDGDVLADDDAKNARVARLDIRTWVKLKAALIEAGLIRVEEGMLVIPLIAKMRSWIGREPITPAVRKNVFERDGKVCRYCGNTDGPFHLDHIHPSHLGGPSSFENLVVACASCNFSKGGLTLEEWCG